MKADYLEVAADLPEAAAIVANLVREMDSKQEARRRFVNEFVRPWGMEVPAQPDHGARYRGRRRPAIAPANKIHAGGSGGVAAACAVAVSARPCGG